MKHLLLGISFLVSGFYQLTQQSPDTGFALFFLGIIFIFHFLIIGVDALFAVSFKTECISFTRELYVQQLRKRKQNELSTNTSLLKANIDVHRNVGNCYYARPTINNHRTETVELGDELPSPCINALSFHLEPNSRQVNEFSVFDEPDLQLANPATGEVMVGGMGGVDTSGNLYGSDVDSFSRDYTTDYFSNCDTSTFNEEYCQFDDY